MQRKYYLMIVLGLVYLPTAYVVAAMASLNDAYFNGITDFKRPFTIINLIYLSVMVLLAASLPAIKKKYPSFVKPIAQISLVYLVVNIVVFMFGYIPCLVEIVKPDTLLQVVKESLACPSYSNRSEFELYFKIILGLVVYALAKSYRSSNKQINLDAKHAAKQRV